MAIGCVGAAHAHAAACARARDDHRHPPCRPVDGRSYQLVPYHRSRARDPGCCHHQIFAHHARSPPRRSRGGMCVPPLVRLDAHRRWRVLAVRAPGGTGRHHHRQPCCGSLLDGICCLAVTVMEKSRRLPGTRAPGRRLRTSTCGKLTSVAVQSAAAAWELHSAAFGAAVRWRAAGGGAAARSPHQFRFKLLNTQVGVLVRQFSLLDRLFLRSYVYRK
eukprot:COSAG01_NODE_4537_length_4938_cov_369.479025_3_plen_218_part_00